MSEAGVKLVFDAKSKSLIKPATCWIPLHVAAPH